jgi:hypothetical protein
MLVVKEEKRKKISSQWLITLPLSSWKDRPSAKEEATTMILEAIDLVEIWVNEMLPYLGQGWNVDHV